MEVPVHARPVLVAAFLGLFLATSAGAAVDAGSSVGFRFLPQKAFQGQPASLSVIARPSGVRCVPTIRYANGATQALKPTIARGNRASWAFKIPAKARIGSASATVKCGRAGKVTRSFSVVGPPAAPAKIVIKKSGFSQRVRSIQREVSYGIVLSNDSPEKDALGVSVIINFIDSTNRVVATQSELIGAVGAGTDFYLGGSTSIPDSTPVSTLEIVTRIGGQDMAAKLGPPTFDVLVQQALYDPGWVGAVVGQITNDHPTMLLASSSVYTVVFDASGNVLGGGKGYGSSGALLPGVRAYFSASSGVTSIPIDRAVSAGVTVLARYEPTG
jgi:hypothetical protein